MTRSSPEVGLFSGRHNLSAPTFEASLIHPLELLSQVVQVKRGYQIMTITTGSRSLADTLTILKLQ